LNSEPTLIPLLSQVDWHGVSLEDFVTADTLLISNLTEENAELRIGNTLYSSALNLLGESIVSNSRLKLKPMEVALICI
jgi:hypothetical protein